MSLLLTLQVVHRRLAATLCHVPLLTLKVGHRAPFFNMLLIKYHLLQLTLQVVHRNPFFDLLLLCATYYCLLYKVFTAPVFNGTGVATKNVLALARGIPLVTTKVALLFK